MQHLEENQYSFAEQQWQQQNGYAETAEFSDKVSAQNKEEAQAQQVVNRLYSLP